ncbi:MAG: hypothetical protein M1827_003976 [Pycnora praestabilis]|nr:MAG: hypothetical protein M1827_003976 [Pycnora praestabilis]
MPKHSFFSLPLQIGQTNQTLRASQYKTSRKRKRDEEKNESPTNHDHSTSIPASEAKENTAYDATFTPTSHSQIYQWTGSYYVAIDPDDACQYRVAGLAFDEALPSGHFPHAPLKSTADPSPYLKERRQPDIQKELANLNPSLYTPKIFENGSSGHNLRQRHLAVVTTIMHRCLLDGDFIRAGRAWGMILRAEVGGKGTDVRAEGRWGIGAEILLRRDVQVKRQTASDNLDDDTSSHGEMEGVESKAESWFSQHGFTKAKEYYERLILQYPYRRYHPYATDSLDFFPAMFGLWIYAVQEEGRSAKPDIGDDTDLSLEDSNSEDNIHSNAGEERLSSPVQRAKRQFRAYKQRENIRQTQLQQAEEISIRLTELLLSPPYSDSHQLWNLRAMLALWIGDLRLPELPSWEEEPEDDEDDDDAEMVGRGMRSALVRDDLERAMRDREGNVEVARGAFKRARELGGRVWEGAKYLIDDDV